MATWTTTHQLPIAPSGYPITSNKIIFSTVVKKCIYTFSSYSSNGTTRDALFKFDTESLAITKIDFESPENYLFHIMTSSGDKLYIFYIRTQPEGWHDFKLHQFDTTTNLCTDIMDFWSFRILGPPQVKGNLMYIMNLDPYITEFVIIKLDMVAKTTERGVLPSEPDCFYHELLIRNEKLYLLRFSMVERSVAVIDDDNGVLELHRDTYAEDTDEWDVKTYWFDDSLIVTRDGALLLDTFDFENEKWYRVEGNDCWLPSTVEWKTAVKIKNTIYAIIETSKKGPKWSIIQLELRPTLTELCLLDLADRVAVETNSGLKNPYSLNLSLCAKFREWAFCQCGGQSKVVDEEKIHNIMNRVPIGLRSKLDNMIQSRLMVEKH